MRRRWPGGLRIANRRPDASFVCSPPKTASLVGRKLAACPTPGFKFLLSGVNNLCRGAFYERKGFSRRSYAGRRQTAQNREFIDVRTPTACRPAPTLRGRLK